MWNAEMVYKFFFSKQLTMLVLTKLDDNIIMYELFLV